ncbi:MAG: DUF4123 domain-containing protein [Marinobacter sp.]|uniref:DUF4123 domain-containing protein n=1 Tax=Marinobacter sp. TaxID=50741 RepID=UPI003297AE53
MSEPCDFRAQLQVASQPAENPSSVYLVLSGTSAAKPVQHFYATDGLTALPLFQGTQYAGWHEVMPFLVQVTDTSEFLDWIGETDSVDWGWGLVSDASLEEVFGHIRSLTKIVLPDGKEVFFRYWDARYLGAILSGVDDICRARLMGPAHAVVLPDGKVTHHPGTPDHSTSPPEFPWFSLPAETLEKIAVLCWECLVDNTISALSKKKHSPLNQYPQPIARQKVERHLRRLTGGEVVTELSSEHVQTIHNALLREAPKGVH